jgi:hypothetical protein
VGIGKAHIFSGRRIASSSRLETFVFLYRRRYDGFRFEHRFKSRAQAIRRLLEWALDNGATLEEKD